MIVVVFSADIYSKKLRTDHRQYDRQESRCSKPTADVLRN